MHILTDLTPGELCDELEMTAERRQGPALVQPCGPSIAGTHSNKAVSVHSAGPPQENKPRLQGGNSAQKLNEQSSLGGQPAVRTPLRHTSTADLSSHERSTQLMESGHVHQRHSARLAPTLATSATGMLTVVGTTRSVIVHPHTVTALSAVPCELHRATDPRSIEQTQRNRWLQKHGSHRCQGWRAWLRARGELLNCSKFTVCSVQGSTTRDRHGGK